MNGIVRCVLVVGVAMGLAFGGQAAAADIAHGEKIYDANCVPQLPGCWGQKDDGVVDFNVWKVQNPAGPDIDLGFVSRAKRLGEGFHGLQGVKLPGGNGVAEEDPREVLGDDRRHAGHLERQRRLLPRRTATEVGAGDQHVALLELRPEIDVQILEHVVGQILERIEATPMWKPMHMQPVFADAPFFGDGTSEGLFEMGLCLPSGSNLSSGDWERIEEVLSRIFSK